MTGLKRFYDAKKKAGITTQNIAVHVKLSIYSADIDGVNYSTTDW